MAAKPDLTRASEYLTSSARLVDGHFYESFPGFADFGLTIDGALALGSAGGRDAALKQIVSFLDRNGGDSNGQTVNIWTGIGTSDVSGGSLGKEALLAEVTGYDPAFFGGQNVIRALDRAVCTAPIVDVCAAPGNYRYATSVFSQALAVTAQLRAHHAAQAALPIRYLEGLQNGAGPAGSAGAWPSLLPGTGADVDSTAMAVMALNVVGDVDAKASVRAGLVWLAAQQSKIGGFPGVEANSTNSTGLAVQALSLGGSTYAGQISAARRYLATRQNSDGGFDVSATTGGSDVRASTQAVSGAVGISFATLSRDVAGHTAPPPSSRPPASTPAPRPTISPTTPAPPKTTSPGSTSPNTTMPNTTVPNTTTPNTTTPNTTMPNTTMPNTTVPNTTTSRSTTPETTTPNTTTPNTTTPNTTASRSTKPVLDTTARPTMSPHPFVRLPAPTSSTVRLATSSDSTSHPSGPSTPFSARATQSFQPPRANKIAATHTSTAGKTVPTGLASPAADPTQAHGPATVAAPALVNADTHTAALTELAAAVAALGALLTLAGRRRRQAIPRRPAGHRRHR